jgi:hypothetical protein
MGPSALEKKLALQAPHRLNYDARSIAQSAPWSLDARPTDDLRRAIPACLTRGRRCCSESRYGRIRR